jgi:magnesium and cobalt transporter
LGGLIAHEMGHVPHRGESFELAGLRFVVIHTRAGAVRWFKVSPLPTPGSDPLSSPDNAPASGSAA